MQTTIIRSAKYIYKSIAPAQKAIKKYYSTMDVASMKPSWTKIVPRPDPQHGSPCPRSSHCFSSIVPNDGPTTRRPTLVLIGGEAVARTPLGPDQFAWVAEDDANNREGGGWQWRLIGSSIGGAAETARPPQRLAHAQAVVDNKVYIFGGRAGIHMNEAAMNDMWTLDVSDGPGKERWDEVVFAEGGGDAAPEARSFHRMIAVGTDLYVFGGCGASGRLADLHKFDTVRRTWHNLGSSTLLRGRGGANLLPLLAKQDGNNDGSNPVLAVVAGFAGEETNDGHVFRDGKWEGLTMKGLKDLRPRSVCVSGLIPDLGVAVIFGGEVDPSERGHEGAGGFANDLIVLDGTTGALVKTVKAPSSSDDGWPEQRGWSDGAFPSRGVDGDGGTRFYLFGGLTGDDKDPRRLGDLWRCNIVKG